MSVYKDVPITEITLRRFEKPPSDLDACIRRFCMSLGILQSGDSRDVIVDIMKLFIRAKNKQQLLSIEIIFSLLKDRKGATMPNIRRHVRRLREIGLVEKYTLGYRIKEFMSITEFMQRHYKPFLLDPTVERVMEYSKTLDDISASI